MQQKLKYALVLSIFTMVMVYTHSIFSLDATYKHECISTGVFQNETKISCFLDTIEIGYISYTKAPLLSYYVLHTLYVHPEHRKQGYGTQLLRYACDFVKSLGAQKIYIQPGPFEIDAHGHLYKPQDELQEKVKSLVSLYQKNGFAQANAALICCARMAYYCIRLDENAQYLLVRS